MQKIIFILLSAVLLTGCGSNSKKEQIPVKSTQNDSVILTAFFYPSFDERCQVKLTKVDSLSKLEMLILNNIRVDKNQDTFYFKSVTISPEIYHQLDTAVLSKVKSGYKPVSHVNLDGMPVSFLLVEKADTSVMTFSGPQINSDEIFEYLLTESAITSFRQVFNDSIITNYLDDVEGYLDDKKIPSNWKTRRPIDNLREKKYGWKKSYGD